MFSTVKKIHFVGIGGIGMSGIAEILLNQGFQVSGSDLNMSENTSHLESLGAEIMIGHSESNIKEAEVVVYSSAVKPNENVETKSAKDKGIPLIRRAEMLAEVSRMTYNIAVAGTHGKTTTTSMIGLILIKANIDPTIIVGGRLKDFGGTNARLGEGKWTLVEADEYDKSFLQLNPTIAVVNNIESEHLDIYKDFNDIKDTFVEFANKVPFYGFVALGLDDSGCKDIYSKINKKIITFGFSRHADIMGADPHFSERRTSMNVFENNNLLGRIEIGMPGEHNLKNALAAITVARQLDIDFKTIQEALLEFNGVFRRFELKGHYKNCNVIDDYAHHPTEVKATLNAARSGWKKRIICIFQPHTYTRTRDQYEEFGQSFHDADILIVTGIYPARELPIEGISGKLISESAKRFGHKNVLYLENLENLKSTLDNIIGTDDLIMTIGAGTIYKFAELLVKE